MKNTIFTGAGVAIITPMLADGAINFPLLGQIIDEQIAGGTDAIIICGTTGESATMSDEEHIECIRFAVEHTNKRVPVIAGTGSNDTSYALYLSQEAEKLGADALLLVTPYYNKTSQRGLIAHFTTIADGVNIPIILYNVPGRTGVNMTAETTLRIAREFENVVAVKEASGNSTQMDDIIKNKPARFNVISGDDGITFPLVTLGAIGVISVIGNAFPREFSRMVRLALAGDYDSARTIHHSFTELFSLLFVDGNPAGAKSMLSMMGFIENKLRLPLVPTRIVTYEKIREVLRQLSIKC